MSAKHCGTFTNLISKIEEGVQKKQKRRPMHLPPHTHCSGYSFLIFKPRTKTASHELDSSYYLMGALLFAWHRLLRKERIKHSAIFFKDYAMPLDCGLVTLRGHSSCQSVTLYIIFFNQNLVKTI